MPQQVPPPPGPTGDLSSQLEHTPPTRLNLNNNNNNNNQEATASQPGLLAEPELAALEPKPSEEAIPQQVNKKLNGLKNRIIQRPPPLILDKVSNFYDTTSITNETVNFNKTENNNDKTNLIINESNFNNNINTQPLQATTTSANQKFWASLNQNAAALRYRDRQTNSITTTSQSNDINNVTKSSINSPNNLGADLVITQRNSIQSTSRNNTNLNNPIVQKSQSSKIDNLATTNPAENLGIKQNFDDYNLRLNHDSSNPNLIDGTNNLENEDFVRQANENGGNLIGVDNSPPPASNAIQSNNEPPNSATRPRSNNPFLVMDDEENQSNADSNAFDNQSNFHKRPASFIAATDVASFINQQREKQQLQQQSNHVEHNMSHSTATSAGNQTVSSRHLTNQFKNLRIDSGAYLNHMYNHQQQTDSISIDDQKDTIFMNEQEKLQFDEAMGAIYGKSSNKQSSVVPRNPNGTENQSIYGIYGSQNDNLVKYGSSTSRDSESPLPCKPPLDDDPCIQLPMWTDAIYYLNNAELDSSSVAGGAENGQFIHIVENGDIILELDNVKVSGLTLVEFNELLETKPLHLLSAVQTRHSQGLTIDLKRYLNSTFPNNSEDKKLQNLIRENIYRRTVPCTTRPPREGEQNEVDYHFLTKEQFVEMNNKGMLLECGMYGGNYYGTVKPYSNLNNATIYGSLRRREVNQDMQQPLNPNHPVINKMETQNIRPNENPLYENHESLRLYQHNNHSSALSFQHHPQQISSTDSNTNVPYQLSQRPLPPLDDNLTLHKSTNMLAADLEPLPHGWERIIDETHGTYYVDHNTQRTQYEKPYEIELTKGASGFGFTLLEAENGVLLVKNIMHGGPAHLNGTIRPGDILLSAVGVQVSGLQHTDIARLFSTFAVGDRVRLTFARGTYIVDADFVPDEVLFSNGTNGGMSVAVNSDYLRHLNHNSAISHDSQIQQDFDYISITLKRGDQGFGFKINDSAAGQKVKDSETCTNLKQGDILININGQDITNLQHKQVVEILKNCPAGQDASIIVKRKKRFRSKTPLAMHTETSEFTMRNPPHRNCKTPSLDGLMLRRPTISQKTQPFTSSWNTGQLNLGFDNIHQNQITPQTAQLMAQPPLGVDVQGISMQENYGSLPVHINNQSNNGQSIYGVHPNNNDPYYSHQMNSLPMIASSNKSAPMIVQDRRELGLRPPSISGSDRIGLDQTSNSVQLSETSLLPMKYSNLNGLNQTNQYNNFMNNDKLVMMQMHQPLYQQTNQVVSSSSSVYNHPDYSHMPLYSNADLIRDDASQLTCKPSMETYQESPYDAKFQNNYYANNEEIEQQRAQFNSTTYSNQQPMNYIQQHQSLQQQPQPIYGTTVVNNSQGIDEYEYHEIVLNRDNSDSNWGIRLVGGSEADRAISIGSIVNGGAASKNGKLKHGDEIITINGINVVGATHRHVVELISACSNQATLVFRRNKFAEAWEVILNRNMNEGFGFVIISKDDCVLIGKISPDSPADRCRQLHITDQIIGVNGRLIERGMKHSDIVNMIKESGSTLHLTIIPADCYSVELIKNAQNDNFGFCMRGVSEHHGTTLYIRSIAPNGLARDLLNVGDQIIAINGIPTVGMTHQQAATIIKYSDPIVKLKLRRNHVTPPSLLVDSPRALQKYNQVTAEIKTIIQNPTPIYLQDQPSTSTQGSYSNYAGQTVPIMINGNQRMNQQHLEYQENNTQDDSNAITYNPSMPLYAT